MAIPASSFPPMLQPVALVPLMQGQPSGWPIARLALRSVQRAAPRLRIPRVHRTIARHLLKVKGSTSAVQRGEGMGGVTNPVGLVRGRAAQRAPASPIHLIRHRR